MDLDNLERRGVPHDLQCDACSRWLPRGMAGWHEESDDGHYVYCTQCVGAERRRTKWRSK